MGLVSAVNLYNINKGQEIPIEHAKTLITGHSGAARGLNPKYFSSAQNIAQPAEPYILTYWKLKRIFEIYNPETLLLSFNPVDLAETNDLRFSTGLWSDEVFKRSYLLKNIFKIDPRIPVDYSKFFSVMVKRISLIPKRDHVEFIGGYICENDTARNFDNAQRFRDRDLLVDDKEAAISEISISYLDSIRRLCDSKNIRLVLVGTPAHNSYIEIIPKHIWHRYETIKTQYEEDYLVIDRTQNNYADSLFYDSAHLNELGATKFTHEVIYELEKSNLSAMNSHIVKKKGQN